MLACGVIERTDDDDFYDIPKRIDHDVSPTEDAGNVDISDGAKFYEDAGTKDVDAELDTDASDANYNGSADATNGENVEFVYHPYMINHIIITGQSNSVANGASPSITTTQPYSNLMFNVGVMTAENCNGQGCTIYQAPNYFVPLIEGDRFFNYEVETMSSSFANEITALNNEHVSLVSIVGKSGSVYKCLGRNGCNWFSQSFIKPFEESLRQVVDAKLIAEQSNRSYIVRAITAIHGESDHYGSIFPQSNSNGSWAEADKLHDYKEALFEWQRDYDREIKLITHQQDDIPLFISQISGWTDRQISQVAIDQYYAHKESNGKVILVAPSYFLDFKSDCLHFSPVGEQRLGEYFAKAYYQTIILGKNFEPLRPRSISFSGNQKVIIDYIVPSPPLVFDTAAVKNPGDYGFDVYEKGNRAVIQSVVIVGTTVELSFSAPLDTSDVVVNFALNQRASACIGPQSGARGNLRDSDSTKSLRGDKLYNWGVQFSEQVKQ